MGLFNSVIVRPPSSNLVRCVSTNPLRSTVDPEAAVRQHRAYVNVLREHGIEVIYLSPSTNFPDSVFIQDTAVVGAKSRTAVIARFGEVSRRGEEKEVKLLLQNMGYQISEVTEPGTLEGGDVLVTDFGVVFIGLTKRTNEVGIEQFKRVFKNVDVVAVPVKEVLHLLSAINYLGNKTFAVVPEYIDVSYFKGFKLIRVPLDEAYAANMLYLGNRYVIMPAGYPKTAERLRKEGYRPVEVDVSEFWKCDGGVTCLSLPLYSVL